MSTNLSSRCYQGRHAPQCTHMVVTDGRAVECMCGCHRTEPESLRLNARNLLRAAEQLTAAAGHLAQVAQCIRAAHDALNPAGRRRYRTGILIQHTDTLANTIDKVCRELHTGLNMLGSVDR